MAANAGRKSAPAGLKLLQGRGNGTDSGGRKVKATPGFQRLPPKRPAGLSDVAGALWDEVVPQLQRLQLLTPQHGPALQLLCEAYARWRAASKQLADEKLTYTSAGLRKLNPLVGVVERASAEYRAWCAEFGMTPASENKLASPEGGGGEENPFAGSG